MKSGEKYTIQNLGKQLHFSYPLWKINTNKYLLAGEGIRIVFEDGTEKIINGYLEIEYLDNQVVKIYNQEIIYQTIGEETTIYLSEDIEIKLGSKNISKNGEIQMSLENMVIDSEDNVTIIDVDDEEDNEEENEEQMEISNSQNSQTTNNNQQTSNQNNNQQNNGGSNLPQINGSGSGNIEDIVEHNPEVIQTPKFKITSFGISTTGVTAQISITDEENLLKEATNIRIIKEETGKIVYENSYALGEYELSIDVQSLSPNTEYVLQVESGYQVDDIIYQRNFIYKAFRTNVTGVDFEKDVFTNKSMGFKVKFEPNSQITKADFEIIGKDGRKIQVQEINNPSIANGGEVNVEFTELEPNTSYTIKLTNVLYDGKILVNSFDIIKEYTTLKNRPIISGTEYEIDKREGNFVLKLLNVEDSHNGILGYRYEIYKTDDDSMQQMTPIKTIETSEREIIVPVEANNIENLLQEENKVYRENYYTYKVVAIFNDNEKICEYESEYSQTMHMGGVEFPKVKFEASKITYESIKGVIIIEDDENAVNYDKNISVIYEDSIGKTQSFVTQISTESRIIPVDINNLRANDTYKFSIYGEIDLQDGNPPIENCYIGSVVVKTKEPENLIATYTEDTEDTDFTKSFNVNFQLSSENQNGEELEANTLTGMTFRIYSGQTLENEVPTGTLKGTKTLVDNNIDPYESELKEIYYDNSVSINPQFFNLNNSDFEGEWYTIVVSNAYDYTDYPNELPIINSLYNVQSINSKPDMSENPEKYFSIVAIRNYQSEEPSDELDASTIVGYKVKSIYDNEEGNAKKIIYRVYDAKTNQEIEAQEKDVVDGKFPEAIFNVGVGTENTKIDEDMMRRGNEYYFTMEIFFDLNGDDILEEGEKGDEVRSNSVYPEKEVPSIIMYPSSSTADTRTYKYKLKDIDKALITNEITAKINGKMVTKPIETTGDNAFNVLIFEGLERGNLNISVKQATMKTEEEEVILINEFFEGENSISGLKYKVELSDKNNILIKLCDINGNTYNIPEMENVTAFRVNLKIGNETKYTTLKTASDNEISIDYYDISNINEMLGKKITVEVQAFYDTGKVGYDIASDYVLFQKAYLEGEDKFYYNLAENQAFVENPAIMGNLYIKSNIEEPNKFKIVNALNDKFQNVIDLEYSSQGMKYEYGIVLQKEIGEQTLTCEGSNQIDFEPEIIPGISLEDEKGDLKITAELEKAQIKAKLYLIEGMELEDNAIYIDLYKLDENNRIIGDVTTIETDAADFDGKREIVLEGLEPKAKYGIKFKAKIKDKIYNGASEYDYLYDIDDDEKGREYRFSTLADVGIDNIVINYVANKYNDKTIDINYTLERTLGYDRIEYMFSKINPTTGEVEPALYEAETKIDMLKKEMKHSIAVNPGDSLFEVGEEYKIKLTAYAIKNNGEEIKVGEKESEIFKLEKLTEPVIAINGKRTNEKNIEFNITIYDEHKIIKDGKYQIEVYTSNGDTVYTEKNCDIEVKNKLLTIENADSNLSYILKIITNVDRQNNGITTEKSKLYEVSKANEYEISLGRVEAITNKDNSKHIDLRFFNSYNLNKIDKIKYTVYNTEGYSSSNESSFTPRFIEVGTESYAMITLEENIESEGNYGIEIQFIKYREDAVNEEDKEDVVEDISIEYFYHKN